MRRLYSVPAGVLKESNEITLKISDYRGGGGLYGPANEIYLKVGDKTIPLSGKWKYKVSASNSDFDFVEYGPNAYPSLLYNAMVSPLVGLSMRGVIWYQGENNTNRAKEYYHLFPAMINDWRKNGGKTFHFIGFNLLIIWMRLKSLRKVCGRKFVKPKRKHFLYLIPVRP